MSHCLRIRRLQAWRNTSAIARTSLSPIQNEAAAHAGRLRPKYILGKCVPEVRARLSESVPDPMLYSPHDACYSAPGAVAHAPVLTRDTRDPWWPPWPAWPRATTTTTLQPASKRQASSFTVTARDLGDYDDSRSVYRLAGRDRDQQDTGKVLYEWDAHVQRRMASTTKIMTADPGAWRRWISRHLSPPLRRRPGPSSRSTG